MIPDPGCGFLEKILAFLNGMQYNKSAKKTRKG
jgi:hypothetical protein